MGNPPAALSDVLYKNLYYLCVCLRVCLCLCRSGAITGFKLYRGLKGLYRCCIKHSKVPLE